ncbi:MAG: DNA polymerase III subunit delta [Parvibaculaceae bacterium]|nr:DNA polymerase III subunit delta [Parvibaculaceae bacterium]
MKIKPADADRFAGRPDGAVRAVLVYGPDRGLVRDRIKRLTKSVVEDPTDPFRIADIAEADLRKDPARLADEAAAISMLDGRRVVRIDDAGDSVAKILQGFIEDPAGDALVLVESGDLGPRSALRKLFEDAKNAAALACYADDAQALDQIIREKLTAAGLRPEPAALDYLVHHLGSDRGITLSELEKLALYIDLPSPGETRTVGLADVCAAIGDSAASGLDDLIDAVAGGDVGALDLAWARARALDANAVQILNMLIRHFSQLQLLAAHLEGGSPPDAAMRAMRPPVHFSRQNAVRRQMNLWTRRKADRALELLLEADSQLKRTGLPDDAICGQLCLRLAMAAQAGRR